MKIKLQKYSIISNEWINDKISEFENRDGHDYYKGQLHILQSLKQQLIPSEKLGEEINKVDNEKWYKVFAPKCRNEVGITVRYEIIYIRGDELSEIRDYEILKEYGNRFSIIQELNKEK
jgi:hypothetical protein